MWTQFWDMHSGGGTKEAPYDKIYIQAPVDEAIVIFYNRFGHSPYRVSCSCCGEDYSVSEAKYLGQLTAFHRNCRYDKKLEKYVERVNHLYGKYMTLKNYRLQKNVLIIYKKDIKPVEREGSAPQQGYVWA